MNVFIFKQLVLMVDGYNSNTPVHEPVSGVSQWIWNFYTSKKSKKYVFSKLLR